MNFITFLLTIALIVCIDGYRILVLFPLPGPSHHVYAGKFIAELLSAGHEITVICNFGIGQHSNLTEIRITPTYDLSNTMKPSGSIFDQTDVNEFEYILRLYKIGLLTTEYAFNRNVIQDFIDTDQSHFDLILAEQFHQESFLMFAHKYKAPIVTLCTIGYSDYLDGIMGLQTHWSHIPHMLLSYDDQMTFGQRMHNTIVSVYDMIYREFIYLPKMEQMAQKYFQKYQPLPSVRQLEKNISIIFVNAHHSLNPVRPTIAGLVDVGGAHVKPAKPLPDDIQKFIDEAEHGVIYFSMGAFVQSSQMPTIKVESILNVIRKLKQRVLWKWENDNLPNKPSNLMIKKWTDQSDILEHPNVILFITHGGLFGSIEGIHRGIPMLFIPIFGDQHRNALRAVRKGYARILYFYDLTEQTLFDNINELISNKSYGATARGISTLLKDNPIDPMKEFLYWIEYVIRHRGAKHLKSSAVEMPFIEYHLIDVFGVILIAILIVIFVGYKLIKCTFHCLNMKLKKD